MLNPYFGPCTILVANTVIDGKDTASCPKGFTIVASGVTITRSKIYGSVHGQGSNGFAFTVSDSLIDGGLPAFGGVACVNCGVDGWNFTLTRVEIVHTNRGAYCSNHCTITDSWIHDVNLDQSDCPQASSGTCPHASAVRAEFYATLTHNVLDCDFGMHGEHFNADLGCSADVTGYPDYQIVAHNTMTNNLLRANPVGASFCAYGGASLGKAFTNDPANATYIVWRNNVFERGPNRSTYGSGPGVCGAFGPTGDFAAATRTGNVWSGNVYSDGTSIPVG